MRLLSADAYDSILGPLRGKRLGYVRGEHGNVGDTMQERAVYQLGRVYGLDLKWLGPVVPDREPWNWGLADGRWDGTLTVEVDELLLFGGGNMGLPGGSRCIRDKAAALGLPITLLPNSWRAPETVSGCVRAWARESESIRLFAPEASLGPDLGLGMAFGKGVRALRPEKELGMFLRTDPEGKFPGALPEVNQGPAFSFAHKRNVLGYLRLAASFERIVTDALHFAVAGLMAGREVWLVPGLYHKNLGMYNCWLKDLGCHWMDEPRIV